MADAAILILFFLVAALYSSVGHGGASGYLAIMALLLGVEESVARPTALMLNLLVAVIATVQFARTGSVPWREALPFCLGSIPFAFWGGSITLTDHLYRVLVGCVLILAALRLLLGSFADRPTQLPNTPICVMVGVILGMLAGLTGTGGGIFLTPLILFAGWAKPKQASGISVLFILVNSAAGLAGRATASLGALPADALGWLIAAGLGGLAGSWFGARRTPAPIMRRLLALVLLIAAGKLLAS